METLEEIQRFDKALRLVEKYESYLFRRAMGIALIICGFVFPFTAYLVLKAQIIADLLNMSPQAFLSFVPTLILLFGMTMIIYNFTSAHVITSRMRKQSIWKDAPHMVFMFFIWFIAFYLTNYIPEPFTTISWLWAGGGASLLSYLFMFSDQADAQFKELLIIGGICIISSLPLLFIKDEQLVLNATFLIFSLSFIIVGVFSTINASKILSEGER